MVCTQAYRDIFDLMNMCRGKYCVEKFREHIENEDQTVISNIFTFSKQPMTEFTEVLKREQKVAKKFHIFF